MNFFRDLNPSNIDVNRLLGRIYVTAKNTDMAYKYITAAQATHSKHPELKALQTNI